MDFADYRPLVIGHWEDAFGILCRLKRVGIDVTFGDGIGHWASCAPTAQTRNKNVATQRKPKPFTIHQKSLPYCSLLTFSDGVRK
ncbi:hypothetical protein [Nitratifractor sp.]